MSHTKDMRHALEHSLDALEMLAFNQGFEACANAIDELSNEMHNSGDTIAAEILRQTAKELRGENV
jgi:hypothetical protein